MPRPSTFVAALVVCSLTAVGSPVDVRADPPRACEPSRVAYLGIDGVFTAGRSPGHVYFHVDNRSDSEVEIVLVRVDLMEGDQATRLEVDSVIDDASEAILGRRISLAARDSRRLRVFIDTPVRGMSYRIRGTFADGRCRYEVYSTLVFAHRTPVVVR